GSRCARRAPAPRGSTPTTTVDRPRDGPSRWPRPSRPRSARRAPRGASTPGAYAARARGPPLRRQYWRRRGCAPPWAGRYRLGLLGSFPFVAITVVVMPTATAPRVIRPAVLVKNPAAAPAAAPTPPPAAVAATPVMPSKPAGNAGLPATSNTLTGPPGATGAALRSAGHSSILRTTIAVPSAERAWEKSDFV